MDKYVARMLGDLQLAGLSERTQVAYMRAVRQLRDHWQKCPSKIGEEELREYFLYLKNDREFAPGSLKIAFNGIKFFYAHTVPREWVTLLRMKIPKQTTLPDVLTRSEVHKLIATVHTHHNRVYFWAVYSLGLRLNEGLSLQVGDIDSQRMMVHVHRGKGAKDRFVILPTSTRQRLREYWATHRNPVWLFPSLGRSGNDGPTAKSPMTPSTVQGVMRRLVEQQRIRKGVSIHTLRHSYATHLLEAGVSIRQVQRLLGHSSLSTTMRYLHLTDPNSANVRQIIEQVFTTDGPEGEKGTR